MDGIENILGIAAGSGVYWLVQRLMQHQFMHLNLAAELVKYAARENATAEWRWLPLSPNYSRRSLPEAARLHLFLPVGDLDFRIDPAWRSIG
jgi:hypothetical protein